jgi:hypothetical protein
MMWFDTGANQIKIRNNVNTSWITVGTIDPFQWSAVPAAPLEVPTGTIIFQISPNTSSGWLLLVEGTIGDASSNSTVMAHVSMQSLYSIVWLSFSNSWCPVQTSAGATSSRGGSWDADWAAHKRLFLPRISGRALAVAGYGSGLTSREAGSYVGEELHALTSGEMWHNHEITGSNRAQGPAGGVLTFNSPTGYPIVTAAGHNNMQPTTFLWAWIKY